jgi:hypothetical protein
MSPPHANLEVLMGAYFHQDWMSESSDPGEIVRSFCQNEPVAVVRGAIKEIRQLLAAHPSEQQVEALLASLGGYLSFAQTGIPATTWLARAAEIMEHSANDAH